MPLEHPRDILKIDFKRGDTFNLSLSVQNNTGQDVLRTRLAYEKAASAYAEEYEKDTPDSDTLTNLYNSLETALNDFKTTSVLDITDWNIKSQIRRSQKKIDDLDITITDSFKGEFVLSADPERTALWPARELECDIEITRDTGIVISSETFIINVIQDITSQDDK